MSRKLHRALPLLILFSVSVCDLDANELECELAADHLKDCCPGFEPETDIQCFQTDNCTGESPDITEEASDCIQDLKCDELVRLGICRYFLEVRTTDELVEAEKVCQ